MEAQYLHNFNPEEIEAADKLKDPKTLAQYIAVPPEGVKAGWATDRMCVVQGGDIIGFRMPLEKKEGEAPKESDLTLGRVLGLVVVNADGKECDPPMLNVLAWGDGLGCVFQRWVEHNWVYFSRKPGQPLDKWFINAEFGFEDTELILRLCNYGSMSDSYFGELVGSDGELVPPRNAPVYRSVFDPGRLLTKALADFESYLIKLGFRRWEQGRHYFPSEVLPRFLATYPTVTEDVTRLREYASQTKVAKEKC